MPGDLVYKTNWGLTHIEKWWDHPGDTSVVGSVVCDYMAQIWRRLQAGLGTTLMEANGPFNGHVIETWHSIRADNTYDAIDWDIEHSAGLTTFHNTKVNHAYASQKVYSHEFGHNHAQSMGLNWDGQKNFSVTNCQVTEAIKKEYRRLRSADFTNRTNETERWAEDFKFFFGCDGVALVRDWADDADCVNLVGRQVRWMDEIHGLKNLMQYAWPVYDHLKSVNIANFDFLDTVGEGYYRWLNLSTNLWECYFNGAFYKWQYVNNKWDWVPE